MSLQYYIDGYNVIHQFTAFQELARHDLEAARGALIEELMSFCSASDARVSVVFDGQGDAQKPAGVPGVPRLTIAFSPGKLSADTYIESAVYVAKDRRSIVVVSGDRGIRDLCMGIGASTLRPEYFMEMARSALRENTAGLARPSPLTQMGSMQDRLSDSGIAALEGLRRRLDKRR